MMNNTNNYNVPLPDTGVAIVAFDNVSINLVYFCLSDVTSVEWIHETRENKKDKYESKGIKKIV